MLERYGNYGLGDTSIEMVFTGIAGQSFGAFNVAGLHLHLTGSANDYVGKSMAAGSITVVAAVKDGAFATPIVGNTCLYGATGGEVYVQGQAGERFGVRNSGALACVLGAGDHCCEYMTGGVVMVLGPTGTNFGAGMSGGFAYVWDVEGSLAVNLNDVASIRLDEQHQAFALTLIKRYHRATQCAFVRDIRDRFATYAPSLRLVYPKHLDSKQLIDKFSPLRTNMDTRQVG